MARTWKCLDCPMTGIQHTGRLRVRCDSCKIEFKRESAKKNYQANPEKFKQQNKEYRQQNPEKVRNQKRRYKAQVRGYGSPEGFIYAIEAEGTGTVKIGFSTTLEGVEARRKHCQTGNAAQLKTIAVARGRMIDERDLHYKLTQWRKTGEWFDLSGAVARAIEHIAKDRVTEYEVAA